MYTVLNFIYVKQYTVNIELISTVFDIDILGLTVNWLDFNGGGNSKDDKVLEVRTRINSYLFSVFFVICVVDPPRIRCLFRRIRRKGYDLYKTTTSYCSCALCNRYLRRLKTSRWSVYQNDTNIHIERTKSSRRVLKVLLNYTRQIYLVLHYDFTKDLVISRASVGKVLGVNRRYNHIR